MNQDLQLLIKKEIDFMGSLYHKVIKGQADGFVEMSKNGWKTYLWVNDVKLGKN